MSEEESEIEGQEVMLPAEVLTIIMRKVIDSLDDPSVALARMECVNRLWRDVAVRLYRDLCLRRKHLRKPYLDPVYTWHKFDQEIRSDPHRY